MLQREKRDVFIWKRGLGSSYYLNCGSYKRLSHPLKEELQLFCPVTKEQTFWWGCWSPPQRGGEGAGTTGCVTATTSKQMSNQPANLLAHKGRKRSLNASSTITSTLLRGIKKYDLSRGRLMIRCRICSISHFKWNLLSLEIKWCFPSSAKQFTSSPWVESPRSFCNQNVAILTISNNKP